MGSIYFPKKLLEMAVIDCSCLPTDRLVGDDMIIHYHKHIGDVVVINSIEYTKNNTHNMGSFRYS